MYVSICKSTTAAYWPVLLAQHSQMIVHRRVLGVAAQTQRIRTHLTVLTVPVLNHQQLRATRQSLCVAFLRHTQHYQLMVERCDAADVKVSTKRCDRIHLDGRHVEHISQLHFHFNINFTWCSGGSVSIDGARGAEPRLRMRHTRTVSAQPISKVRSSDQRRLHL